MDDIHYFQALNRPTYLIWRFTHRDIQWMFGVIIVTLLPAGVSDSYPLHYALLVNFAYVMYRGAIVTLKPAGWEGHTIASWFEESTLNPGHTLNTFFIVERVNDGPDTRWKTIKRRWRAMLYQAKGRMT